MKDFGKGCKAAGVKLKGIEFVRYRHLNNGGRL
jgi:hypothetical protein